ncbi:hypothetical protein IFM89_002752 [Coptis chinensis]|uniref:Transducin/WD40 repeat-like superfamily protein n=1 Tax=Coptis chinensis TaxID=261450 RepID=A0A835HTR3_9MAGN|nr:hypothetical protein IFM89_002752 [Coptis chinensis]
MVQATGGQFDIAKEEESVPLRKTRGRPRKQKKVEESFANLGKECHFVPPLAVDVSLESLCSLGSENLGQALAVQLDNAEEKGVVTFRRSRGRTRIKSLDDSNRENQMFQATGQIDHPKDKESLPLRKASERIRKKREIKEFLLRLDTESQFVPPLAFDICQDPLGALGGEIQGQASAAQLVNANEKDTHPFRRPRGKPGKKTRCKSKSVQGVDGQLDNVKEKDSLPLNKAKGRLRKQKDIKEGLLVDTESQVVPPLAVDISQEALDNMKEKDSLPLKKAEGGLRKQKDIKGGLLVDTESQFVPPLAVDISQEASGFLAITEATRSTEEQAMVESWDTGVGLETQALDQCRYKLTKLKRKKKDKTLRVTHHVTTSSLTLAQDKDMDTSFDVLHGNKGFDQDAIASSLKVANNGSLEISSNSFNPPKDVALPRVVLCLAHNGKVAWDVKWRPPNVCDVENKHRMGYLAVALGNGSLEVWEVPSPRAIEVLFSSCKKEGTDPRFVKLEPVFRCSKLMSGDRHRLACGSSLQVVPLKIFSNSANTRPLLCFSADTFPIRALAWAPNESDEESANIVVTAGHGGGLRFWDIRIVSGYEVIGTTTPKAAISSKKLQAVVYGAPVMAPRRPNALGKPCLASEDIGYTGYQKGKSASVTGTSVQQARAEETDPYRPLWDLSSVHRFIYSLDWLPDPRCVIIAFDDGALRILSFSEAAYDVAVTGKPLGGQVAYCSSDGLAIRFQLTSKAVNKYRSSNRAPHFLCGSLTEEDAALIVNTPLLNIHFPTKKSVPMNKSLNKCGPISKQAKGAKEQAPDDEPLDLCFDDDTSEFGVEYTVSSSKGKNTTKKSKKMMKSNEDEAQTDNESPGKVTSKMSKKNTWKNEEGAQTEIGVFPPKIVAMHRVRWNMNKGSERWLCYGGAAGVV